MSLILGALISVVSLLAGGIGIWVFARPGVRRVRGAADAILGEEEVRDRAGNLITPARPGLVHLQRENAERIGRVEEAIIEFKHLTGIMTEFSGRLDRFEHRVTALEDQRVKDIVTAAERAATAASATEALRLIRDRDTEDGETTGPELEP